MRNGAALAALALLPCWGCGSDAAHHTAPTVPVKGRITYKGRPLTQGTVVFEPADIGREAHGDVQSDGTFVLSTFKEGDGAVPGLHRVAVSGNPKAGKEAVPLKYRNPSSSKTEIEVTEGKAEYAVDLK